VRLWPLFRIWGRRPNFATKAGIWAVGSSCLHSWEREWPHAPPPVWDAGSAEVSRDLLPPPSGDHTIKSHSMSSYFIFRPTGRVISCTLVYSRVLSGTLAPAGRTRPTGRGGSRGPSRAARACRGGVVAVPWRCRGGAVAVPWRCRGGVVAVSSTCRGGVMSTHPRGAAWLPGSGAPPSSPARHGPPAPGWGALFPTPFLAALRARGGRARATTEVCGLLAQAHHAASRSYDRFVAPHRLATLTTTPALPESEERGSAVPSILVLVRACRLAGVGMLRAT